jgi:DNA polymerase (family 10)
MSIRNTEIADIFDALADTLEVEGENPFKIRAYRNAARLVRGLGPELADMIAAGESPTDLPGIGKDLAAKIAEILATGTTRALEEARQRIPIGVIEMLRLPGLGPKRASVIYRDLGIDSLAALKAAAEAGHIRSLPGFGAKTEMGILQAASAAVERGKRVSIAQVGPRIEDMLSDLRRIPGVIRAEAAGSYRRRLETVGDVDLLVAAEPGSAVMEGFGAFAAAGQVLAQGDTKSSILLASGLQVDLRLVAESDFGAALQYFTGSKAHNVRIRHIGRRRGLKINEYGVFTLEARVAGDTEESVYRTIDLPWIPPELREDRGEVEAAAEGRLPSLVELADIRGELHSHTAETDGRNRLVEMAEAARERGLKYLAITDHSQTLRMVDGLDERRLMAQADEIDRLNETLQGFTILKGIEVEILEDGSLDFPDSVLQRLDLVIGSVHTRFQLTREQQTARILRAMDHRCFSILGHPSGRLIGEREPYPVDMAAVIRRAKERGCFLELNANPARLDLSDIHCQMARDAGVLIAINTDAHSTAEFGQLRHGVNQARRGWLEKKDVLNTRPLPALHKLLKGTMGR